MLDHALRRGIPGEAPVVWQPTRRSMPWFVGLWLLLGILFVLSVGHGAVSISPGQVVAILAQHLGIELSWDFTPQQESVLMAIRLPRVMLGLLIGAGLGAAGAAMQALFRNPLADPALVGVSSGAALGAVTMIVVGNSVIRCIPWIPIPILVPLASFLGGLASTMVVHRLAQRGGRTGVATMLLAGIAVNALAQSGTGFFTFLATDAQLRSITFWSLGSLGGATWESLAVVTLGILPALLILPCFARGLNALLLGENEAAHLGFSVEFIKRALVVLVALAVGASVAVSGIIAFVGLLVPHLARLMLGPDHRVLLKASALLGASLLLAADLVARIIVAPAELPIGIVTAAVGAPFFILLLTRIQTRGGGS